MELVIEYIKNDGVGDRFVPVDDSQHIQSTTWLLRKMDFSKAITLFSFKLQEHDYYLIHNKFSALS